jgi:hypothetical protein
MKWLLCRAAGYEVPVRLVIQYLAKRCRQTCSNAVSNTKELKYLSSSLTQKRQWPRIDLHESYDTRFRPEQQAGSRRSVGK